MMLDIIFYLDMGCWTQNQLFTLPIHDIIYKKQKKIRF